MILSTGGQTPGWMDDMKPVYPPFNFIEAGGIITYPCHDMDNTFQESCI